MNRSQWTLFRIPASAGIFVLSRRHYFFFLLFSFFSGEVFSQTTTRYEAPISAPVFSIASQDTFLNINEDSLIAASLSSVDTTIREGKSTTIATLGSMIVPGAGQIYNGSYWKAPLIWGLGYYFYSVYRHQDKLYNETKYKYDTTSAVTSPKLKEDLLNTRDFYKNQRNIFGWYMALTYLLNIVDAYVDAALFNFDVGPNLGGTNEIRVRMNIPLR